MSIDDITPPTIIPSSPYDHPIRVHIQFFQSELLQQFPLDSSVTTNRLCNNQALRLPSNLTDWPRAVVFDFVYGAAALKRWYQKGTLADWEDDIQQSYNEPAAYDHQKGEDHYSSDDSRGDGDDENDETVKLPRMHGQSSENSTRFAMDLVYALWRRDAAPDFRHIKEWLKGITTMKSD